MADNFASIDWGAVVAIVGLLISMIGGMLTIVYKLIVANLAKTTLLYDQRVDSAVKQFTATLEARENLERERVAAYKQDVSALRRRHDKLESELRNTLKDLSRNYVPREDFLKSVTVLEMKLDRVGETIFQMAKEK